MNNNTVNLSLFGYSDNYTINQQGEIYNLSTQQKVNFDEYNRCRIKDKYNNSVRVYLKPLYRKAFNKEYCVDNIKNYPLEEWKPIKKTRGIYFVSNYGRVKSYYGYSAIIRKQDSNSKGYLSVKIKGKTHLTHRLVALYFVQNSDPVEKVVVHHIDKVKTHNVSSNLQWVSHEEHKKIHSGAEKKCSTM